MVWIEISCAWLGDSWRKIKKGVLAKLNDILE